MPVGDVSLVPLLPIRGLKIGICEAHVRYENRRDLTVFGIDDGCYHPKLFCGSPCANRA